MHRRRLRYTRNDHRRARSIHRNQQSGADGQQRHRSRRPPPQRTLGGPLSDARGELLLERVQFRRARTKLARFAEGGASGVAIAGGDRLLRRDNERLEPPLLNPLFEAQPRLRIDAGRDERAPAVAWERRNGAVGFHGASLDTADRRVHGEVINCVVRLVSLTLSHEQALGHMHRSEPRRIARDEGAGGGTMREVGTCEPLD